jgi:hypothetical protein
MNSIQVAKSNVEIEISNALNISRQERDLIKAQMHDASKRLQELDGVVAALVRALELLKEEDKGVTNGTVE